LVNKFVAVSRSMKDLMIEKSEIPSDDISLLYNFVDLNKYDPSKIDQKAADAFRTQHGYTKDDFVIGFAGRIIERKGWRTFLKAASIIKESHPHFKFLLAGEGPESQKLTTMIRDLNISDTTKYIGYFNQMPLLYSAIDVFALPSHFEGLPMTQLEVMAMGVPLVTTDGPGMAEVAVADKDAIYFKMKNADDLAKQLIALKDENLRTNLVKSASETVKQYSLSSYLKSLEKFYQSLA